MAVRPTISGIELFSGVGMLGEGLRAGLGHLGVSYRTVCHVEREAHAAAVLAARMEEGSLDAAPVWSDVCTFDAAAWHGRVDCVVAGFPCQDLSIAGRRAGLDGKRSGLFFEVCRIAHDCGAWLLVLENVAGIATATASVVDQAEGELDERAASRVVGELADLGWDAEWITLSASDVGASHGRARWFCIAWRVDDAQRVERAGQRIHQRPGGGRQGAPEHGWAGQAMDDADVPGQRAGRRRGDDSARSAWAPAEQPVGRRGDQASDLAGGAAVANTDGPVGSGPGFLGARGRADAGVERAPVANPGFERQPITAGGGHARPNEEPHGEPEPVASRDALPLFAPGPADPRWPAILAEHPELAPALEPAFRGVVDGLAFDMGDSRAARLKCVGNGVVALQAAAAFVVLAQRAGIFDMNRNINALREAA